MLDFSKPDAPLTPAQQQQRRRRWVYSLLAVELIVLVCLEGDKWMQLAVSKAATLQLPWPVLALAWVGIVPLVYFLLILVHEGGHVAGARMGGFNIISFVAWRLRIERRKTTWKISWQKSASKLGGMVQAYTSAYRRLRFRYALLVVGGPLANVLTGAGALLLLHAMGEQAKATAPGHLLGWALLVFGWLSLAVGGLNLIPMKLNSGYTNDGQQLLQLAQNGPAMHQRLLIVQLSGASYAGTRPNLWAPALIERLLTHRSGTALDCYAHLYAYAHAHDRNDLEQAQLHLNAALDHRHLCPATLQQHLLCEAAYMAALHTHDAEQARHWLDQAEEIKPFTDTEGLFSRAAVLWVEGEHAQAQQWLQAARTHTADTLDAGGQLQALERIEALEAKLYQAAPPLHPA